MRAAAEASLRRLGVDVIDLLTLHRVDREVPLEDTIGAMGELVTAGLVRLIGLSEVRPTTLLRAAEEHPIAAVQSEHSLWSRDVESGLIEAARQVGTTLVSYAPLGRGFLSGDLHVPSLANDDYRRGLPRFEPGNIEHNVNLLTALRRVARHTGLTPAQVALAWVLKKNSDGIALVGTTSRSHLAENLSVANIELGEEQMLWLDKAFPPGAARGDRYASRATIDG